MMKDKVFFGPSNAVLVVIDVLLALYLYCEHCG